MRTGSEQGHPFDFGKAAFLVIEKGNRGSGEFAIPKRDLLELIRKHSFNKIKGHPVLMVQLVHTPRERGLAVNYDAWTGELRSNVVRLDLLK